MTIRHLQVFSQVCSCGSVTAAAKKLFITQPAASSAIAELEAHYGIRLFDRIGRRLYITETGKRFLGYASHILSLFDELEQVRDWEEGGFLRVGASITVGNHLLPEIVRVFQQQYPAVAVKAVVDNSETIEEQVIHNEIDLGLIEGVVHSPQIESRTFFHDRMVLIVPPGYAAPSGKGKRREGNCGRYSFRSRDPGGAHMAERQHAGDCPGCEPGIGYFPAPRTFGSGCGAAGRSILRRAAGRFAGAGLFGYMAPRKISLPDPTGMDKSLPFDKNRRWDESECLMPAGCRQQKR